MKISQNPESNTLAIRYGLAIPHPLPEIFKTPLILLLRQVRANVSSNHTPVFEVQNLDSHSSYTLVLYAANAKGRSEEVALYTVGIRSPDKYTGKYLYGSFVICLFCLVFLEKLTVAYLARVFHTTCADNSGLFP